MWKRVITGLTVTALLVQASEALGADAQSSRTMGRGQPTQQAQSSGAVPDRVGPWHSSSWQAGAFPPAMLRTVVAWLTKNFDLDPGDTFPTVIRVPRSTITALRYRGLLGAGAGSGTPETTLVSQDIVAVYDDKRRTIYLPEEWTGETPAEMSVLVHEMVHHLQNEAYTKFPCPQAREQLAYAAQQRWLEAHGQTLEEQFQLDPMTLLLTTRCM
jgi:hypothetical protein